ncbi:hypothetical protein ACFX2C_004379 [Malus domestica]
MSTNHWTMRGQLIRLQRLETSDVHRGTEAPPTTISQRIKRPTIHPHSYDRFPPSLTPSLSSIAWGTNNPCFKGIKIAALSICIQRMYAL